MKAMRKMAIVLKKRDLKLRGYRLRTVLTGLLSPETSSVVKQHYHQTEMLQSLSGCLGLVIARGSEK